MKKGAPHIVTSHVKYLQRTAKPIILHKNNKLWIAWACPAYEISSQGIVSGKGVTIFWKKKEKENDSRFQLDRQINEKIRQIRF